VSSRLDAALAENEASVRALEQQHAEIVAASRDANADDEHDPEGATIAFEREQVAALLAQARRTTADLREALDRVARGTYGRCEGCGGPIGEARLEARPTARSCIACASQRR
jgi:DnaK suppressor protein